MNEEIALLTLHLVPNLGPVRIRRLLAQFGTATQVLAASPRELQRVRGISTDLAATICGAVASRCGELEMERLSANNAWLLTELNPLYPEALRQIHNAPVLLQVLGTLRESDRHAISIVGSRHCTYYGMECAKLFSHRLASSGLTIVSGLARGVDTAAHQGALAAKGRTIAVIGSGLGQLYPPENRALSERIREHGAVLSEFPFEAPPNPQTFPYRNRIVAGWSMELLVVEAGSKSGALVTANLALENGRQVYAVPGQIDKEASMGSNRLIQQGAKLVTCAEDILEELQDLFPREGLVRPSWNKAPIRGSLQLPPEEKVLLEALKDGERALDELVETSGLSAAQTSAALLSLELKRLVRPLPGRWFARA